MFFKYILIHTFLFLSLSFKDFIILGIRFIKELMLIPFTIHQRLTLILFLLIKI